MSDHRDRDNLIPATHFVGTRPFAVAEKGESVPGAVESSRFEGPKPQACPKRATHLPHPAHGA